MRTTAGPGAPSSLCHQRPALSVALSDLPATASCACCSTARRACALGFIWASCIGHSAQYTAGKFVFLTYDQASNPASGPSCETVHDVQNYSADRLDYLIVRLVREDLAALGTLQPSFRLIFSQIGLWPRYLLPE